MTLSDGTELTISPREQALFTASTLIQFADAFLRIGAIQSADIAIRHSDALRKAFGYEEQGGRPPDAAGETQP